MIRIKLNGKTLFFALIAGYYVEIKAKTLAEAYKVAFKL